MHGGFTFLCAKCPQAYKTAFNRKRHKALGGTDPTQSPAREAEAEGQGEDVRTERPHRSALQNKDQYLNSSSIQPKTNTKYLGPSKALQNMGITSNPSP